FLSCQNPREPAHPFLGSGAPTPSLLDGQTEYTGPTPGIATVAFTSKAGDALTEDLALSGWDTLIVDPSADQTALKDTIAKAGGTIVDAIPAVGFYTLSVSTGQEA